MLKFHEAPQSRGCLSWVSDTFKIRVVLVAVIMVVVAVAVAVDDIPVSSEQTVK